MSDSNERTVRAATTMMIITLVGKILGLVREMLLASNYGSGMEAIAFQTASRIPRVFFRRHIRVGDFRQFYTYF